MKISIDKIKLACTYLKPYQWTRSKDLRTAINNVAMHYDGIIKEWTSMAINTYRYNFCISVDKTTFYIGFYFNGSYECQREQPKYFIVEFNPNKASSKAWCYLKALCSFKIRECINFDVAFDTDIDINDVIVRTRCDVMRYGNNRPTIYLSPKAREGRIKIYDKAIEQGIQGAIWTRFEISLKGDFLTHTTNDKRLADLDNYLSRFNHDISIVSRSLTDDSTLFMLSRLNPEDRQTSLSLMSVNTRKKYIALLSNEERPFQLDTIKFLDEVIQQYEFLK